MLFIKEYVMCSLITNKAYNYYEILSGLIITYIYIRKKEKSIRNTAGTGILQTLEKLYQNQVPTFRGLEHRRDQVVQTLFLNPLSYDLRFLFYLPITKAGFSVRTGPNYINKIEKQPPLRCKLQGFKPSKHSPNLCLSDKLKL